MKALSIVLFLVVGMTSAGEPGQVFAVGAFQPTFETIDCPPEIAYDKASTISCGYLTVLEDRADPNGRTIRLFVLMAKPLKGDTAPDPIFIPGRDLVGMSPPFVPFGYGVGRVRITMDRRGAGRSEPSLACPEVRRLTDAGTGIVLGSDEMRTALLDAVQACHDRLTAQGIDLSAYNVAEMAADAEDLRIALGIDQWNVQTYGTASAISFEILRRYPDHVRAVVFDSPLPPQVDRFTEAVQGTEYAFDQIVAACLADRACGRQYPHLHAAWNQALRNLHRHPSRFSDEDLEVVVDDATAVRYLRNNMAEGINETRDISEFPLAVYELREHGWQNGGPAGNEVGWAAAPPLHVGYEVQWGDPFALHFDGDTSQVGGGGRPTEGTFYSYMCHDELPFVDEAALKRAAGDRPWYVEAYVHNPYPEICQRWNVSTAETNPHAPVTSDVPVLMMSGRFDPYSPFPLVKKGANGLKNRVVLRVPARSRNVLSADCAVGIRDAFITDPTTGPDTSCLSELNKVLPIEFLPPPPPTRKPKPGDAVITTIAGDGAYGSSGDGNLATQAQLASPTDVAVDPAGNFYVIEWDGGRVRRVDASSGQISTAVGPPTGVAPAPPGDAGTVELRGATALAIDAQGSLYVGGGLGGRNVITRVSPSGDATVIAGTGEGGHSGDGGPATEAKLSWVRDIVVDDGGAVYFTDFTNNRIRKIGPTGTITTIAGTGEKGFSGDGGPATQAKLSHPSGISIDEHGNIYFADRGNNRVRRIDRLGKITTVAGNGNRGYGGDGGPAKKAALGTPLGVLLDANGNLYITSVDCSCVRMIDPKGIIRTIVGTGHAGFSGDGGPARQAQLELSCCPAAGMAFAPTELCTSRTQGTWRTPGSGRWSSHEAESRRHAAPCRCLPRTGAGRGSNAYGRRDGPRLPPDLQDRSLSSARDARDRERDVLWLPESPRGPHQPGRPNDQGLRRPDRAPERQAASGPHVLSDLRQRIGARLQLSRLGGPGGAHEPRGHHHGSSGGRTLEAGAGLSGGQVDRRRHHLGRSRLQARLPRRHAGVPRPVDR